MGGYYGRFLEYRFRRYNYPVLHRSSYRTNDANF